MSGANSIFHVVILCLALAYIVSTYVLAYRLNQLRTAERAHDAPSAREFLFGNLGLAGMLFVFSSRHRRIRDALVTNLVMLNRGLLPGVLTLIVVENLVGF